MNSIPKNLYIDKLVDLVNVYNITYKTNKMKPNDVKTSTYIDFGVQNNDKDLNLVTMYEYQNIKTFLQKVTLQVGQKKVFLLKKLKIL